MTRVGVARRADGSGVALDLATTALLPRVLATTPRGARVALVGARALLLAGDAVHVDVTVGAGCTLDVVEVAGTVAYDGRGGPPSSWTVRARLGEDARLLWHGEPFVVAGGADVLRTLEVDLAPGARALLREVLVLGRSGERGGALLNRTRARREGRALLAEDLDLTDTGLRASPAVLGPARCLDTVTLLGARAEGEDVLQLEGPGSQVRALLTDAHTSPLGAVWARWRTGVLPLGDRAGTTCTTTEGSRLAGAHAGTGRA
ncbi:urease accessory protein UreD [Kineococcus rubinsiae]|uniref:urease accessory protein UreD n=1 Tax=Kineococcus rubinsiae TaxID=2609562 RepID=UPI00143141A5|nr:urease accessory protein UreD [Kineococcus rubinsiae]NIZ91615.1 urease accessory protein UreD [Kineococcus rubinsiae]